MIEERYLKIESCKNCPNFGHTGTKNKLTTFICGYSENMNIEQLPADKIGDKIYPITHIGGWSGTVPIPFWCKLPSKVN